MAEGLDYERRCLEIDPMYMNCVYYVVEGLIAMGQNSEAIQIIEDYFEYTLFSEFIGSEAAVYLQAGKPLAARIVASNIIGLDGAPGEEFIKALENPESDHSEGLRKFDAWADDNGVDLSAHPEILAAFGAYDRVDLALESELWTWLPLYQKYRQSDAFRAQLKKYGTYDLWKSKGFPPQCRPLGDDDFECD